MQVIISYKNSHQLFEDMQTLYSTLSVRGSGVSSSKLLVSSGVSRVFEPLVTLFEQYTGNSWDIEFRDKVYKPIEDIPKSKKSVIVCFSGGKDSVSTVLYYRERGYNVYLYHLRGINQTYNDECVAARQLADKLGVPIIVEEVKLSGKQEWTEHPMKNMIIANMAIQYGLRNRLTTCIAFGNFSSSSLADDPFDVCGGDCREMWECYNRIIQTIIPKFEVQTPLTNFQDTICTMIQHPDILPYTQSCIGAYRYREYLKGCNEKKYGIQLPPHRCGSCWKCCLEYCVFCDNGIYEYNEQYYRHCMQVLRNTIKKETGQPCRTLEEVWDHYFFYPVIQSKFRACI